ncbi:MAG: M48 family metalloprotease [Arenicella sp.]|nr:M48 family metalloprotease [Arenicella sp.]
MDYLEFEEHVKRADALAEKNFSRYKFKLRLFALLGYLVIIGMITIVAVTISGLGALAYLSPALLILLLKKKLIFVLIPMIWVMVRSLWVKLEAPKGYEMTRDRFPEVFKELDALSKELDSLKIHTVLLTPEMNAAVLQTPRLGLLGWQKNTLFLGLELMLSLTSDQVRGVVAHELGHLSGNHSKFSGRIYRIRESWARLMNGLLEQDNVGARIMAKFFSWYAPRFSAYSFPLARNNEYEADAMAASLTNNQAIADALINVHVVAPYLEEHYWQTYFKRADTKPSPDVLPWAGLHDFLKTNRDPKLQEHLDQAILVNTDMSDTHPSLKDRLRALKVPANLPKTTDENAAKIWLAEEYLKVINEFDNEWFEHNADAWKERYEYVTKSTTALFDFRSREVDELNEEDLWQRAQLEGEFGAQKEAIKLLMQYRARKPESEEAAYLLACYLMADKDDKCLALFEQALSSPELAYNACANAFQFLTEAGKPDEAEKWRSRAENADQALQEADAERERLNPGDTLEKVDLNHETVQAVIAKLKESDKIKKAWIAKKAVKHHPEIPAIAIAVVGKGFALSEDSLQKALAEELADFSLWIIPKSGDYKPLAKSIIKAGEQVI